MTRCGVCGLCRAERLGGPCASCCAEIDGQLAGYHTAYLLGDLPGKPAIPGTLAHQSASLVLAHMRFPTVAR